MGPDAFDFELPSELIAQRPAERRGDARLLCVRGDTLEDRRANEVAKLLPRHALVVLNDSRVVPARIYPVRSDGRAFELLLCEVAPSVGDGDVIRAWVRQAKRLKIGDRLRVADVELELLGEDALDARARRFRVHGASLFAALQSRGQVPLPPYITRVNGPDNHDLERYQTTFARHPGSVAAPTAGLHFEPDVLAALDTATVTLHVGPGTFLPMQSADVRDHRVGPERYVITPAAAAKIAQARADKRPIVAVGTTATRTLEGVARAHDGKIVAGEGWIDLMITPEHHWQVVDGLLTNFHLPRSSLLMLVASFAGRERVLAAYRHAVAARYRFFSYGDCMLVERGGEIGERCT